MWPSCGTFPLDFPIIAHSYVFLVEDVALLSRLCPIEVLLHKRLRRMSTFFLVRFQRATKPRPLHEIQIQYILDKFGLNYDVVFADLTRAPSI